MKLRVVIGLLAVVASGCSLSYRHSQHAGKLSRDIGDLDITGYGNTLDLAATFDFRYFRFLTPIELGRRKLTFTAADGGQQDLDLIRERRFYRLDVPVFSFWDFEKGAVGGYPGLMRHRHSFELWVSGESDFHVQNEWWADVGVTYYDYNGLGVRFFVGGGALPFDAATPRPGTRFPALWEGNAPTFGAGLSVTYAAGEYLLDAFEYLAGVDKRHRNRASKQNPTF